MGKWITDPKDYRIGVYACIACHAAHGHLVQISVPFYDEQTNSGQDTLCRKCGEAKYGPAPVAWATAAIQSTAPVTPAVAAAAIFTAYQCVCCGNPVKTSKAMPYACGICADTMARRWAISRKNPGEPARATSGFSELADKIIEFCRHHTHPDDRRGLINAWAKAYGIIAKAKIDRVECANKWCRRSNPNDGLPCYNCGQPQAVR